MSVYQLLNPSETYLQGKWLFTGGSVVADDMCQRIKFLTETVLIKVATDATGWQVLYRDPGDGRYWELQYQDSDEFGGGAPTLKCLNIDSARQKYGTI